MSAGNAAPKSEYCEPFKAWLLLPRNDLNVKLPMPPCGLCAEAFSLRERAQRERQRADAYDQAAEIKIATAHPGVGN